MGDDSASPRETLVRRCPYCQSDAVMPLGRVVADRAAIRCDYQCDACSKKFVFLR
jgi:transcriptional regulator NrdR family protein